MRRTIARIDFPANRCELFAVIRGLVGAARAAMFRRIHIQEARDHLVAVERREQHGRGFARAHDEFSWTVGHRKLTCTRMRRAPQEETLFVRAKEKARTIAARAFVISSFCGFAFLVNRPATGGRSSPSATACDRPHRLLELAQRDFESLFGRAHEVDLHAFEHFRLQIFLHVRLVLRRQNDFPDSRALRAQHLFLDSADRQHDSGERNFSGHRHARPHRPPGQQADQRRDHRDARRRPVLRNRARRHVNVQVELAEEVRVDAVALGIEREPS